MVELHSNYTFTGMRDPIPAGERSEATEEDL